MAISCSNCGTCTCGGSYLVVALNGAQCCSVCVNLYNTQNTPVQSVPPVAPTIKTKQ
jgi:hypothetical protein